MRDLERAGIKVPRDRCMWLTTEEDSDDDNVVRTLYVAFSVERA